MEQFYFYLVDLNKNNQELSLFYVMCSMFHVLLQNNTLCQNWQECEGALIIFIKKVNLKVWKR